jgi:hypothetical protein
VHSYRTHLNNKLINTTQWFAMDIDSSVRRRLYRGMAQGISNASMK